MPRNVLVIEDNRDIAHLVQLHLKDLGCDVSLAYDGSTGYTLAEQNHYDLIILDLMLPGIDGLEICRRVRGKDRVTPILMLTSKSSELDRVLGLEIGADDYLTKPFSLMELMARVKAIFRRSDAISEDGAVQTPAQNISHGPLYIDMDKRAVKLNDKVLDLTAKEFDLLVHFAQHPGRVYSRTQLLDAVWGQGYDGYEHTVNSHINRLRAKLESDPAHPEFILTVWGVGYKFAESEARPESATC
jgi:DNA-binding response OmpR family regulator